MSNNYRRTSSRTALAILTLLAISANLHLWPQDDLRLEVLLLPAESKKALSDLQSRPYITNSEDWYLWCPSVIKNADGKYHMFHSRFPKRLPHDSWLTHSQVIHAVSDQPQGPYRMVAIAIPAVGEDRGEWFDAHNPKIKHFEGQYYIYFIQTRGDISVEDTYQKLAEIDKTGLIKRPKGSRPNQRIFVAKSKSLDGPWQISDGPIIEPAKTITTLTVNPAVCRRTDGSYLMILKGDKPNVKGFVRNQALAVAPAPEGPWTIQDKPVIDNLDTEDASVWYDQTRERYYAVFHANIKSERRGIIGMMTSKDGLDWEKASQYELTPKLIMFDDGSSWKPERMERPFVLTDERGVPQFLFVACKKGDMSAVIALPLSVGD